MRMRHVLVVTLAAALASPAFAGDIIALKSGRMVGNAKASSPPAADQYGDSSFTIEEENLDEVVYKIEGVPTRQSLKYDDVAAIYHDPDSVPPALARGKKAADNGNLENALSLFQEVAKSAAAPKWAQVEGALRAAEALYDMGDLDNAAKALEAFIAKHNKSRWVPHATQHLARIKLDGGDVAGARGLFASLKAMKGLPESERAEVDYWIVWIDEQVAAAKNDKAGFEKALKGYDVLISQIRGKKGLEALAGKSMVGKASCLLGAGQYGEAEQLTAKIIESTKDPLSRAGAYTMLGRAIVLQNTAKNDASKYEEARNHFLRVILLYGEAPGAEAYLAESLYRAGEMFNVLRPANPTSDEDKEAAILARRRAQREWQECVQRFPRSTWAAKARASMGS